MGLSSQHYKAKFPQQVYDGFGEFKSQPITVGAIAGKIPTTPLKHRRAIIITNVDTENDIYIGHDATVTSSTGTPVAKSGGSIVLYLIEDVDIYGIATGDTDVRILEFA